MFLPKDEVLFLFRELNPTFVLKFYNQNQEVPDLPLDTLLSGLVKIDTKYKLHILKHDHDRHLETGLWLFKYYGPDAGRLIVPKKYSKYSNAEVYLMLLAQSQNWDYWPQALHEEFVTQRFKDLTGAKLQPIKSENIEFDGQRTLAMLHYMNKSDFFVHNKQLFLYDIAFFDIFKEKWGPLFIKAMYTDNDTDWEKLGLVAGLDKETLWEDIAMLINKYYRRKLPKEPSKMKKGSSAIYTVAEMIYFFDVPDKLVDIQEITEYTRKVAKKKYNIMLE